MTPTATTDQDVLTLERKYWNALKDKDVAGTLALTDDPCVVTGAQGLGVVDHPTYESMMREASWEILDVEIADDVQVRMLNDDTAFIAYTVRERLLVDGEELTLEAADTSTWTRRDGEWRCALHTEAILGDPYGRDKGSGTPTA